ncbi:MAG: hypothetical protein HYY84_12175 [Deltaproteobacteria bacterium]|nr:hypothetical protein [Deltaproteobacteria bacterium]
MPVEAASTSQGKPGAEVVALPKGDESVIGYVAEAIRALEEEAPNTEPVVLPKPGRSKLRSDFC